MKPRRLGDWKRIADDAHRAGDAGEWWDGERWRPRGEFPHTPAEARAYRTAQDVLSEALAAMVGYEPNSDEAVRAAARFARSAEADRNERSASTLAEAEAELIFKAARPYLHKKPLRNRTGFSEDHAGRTAWTALAKHVSGVTGQNITPNRLRMICRQRGEK